mmetsp:Transcript_69867/g.183228  ORF Transcript_69867/g.183228 Transcript_69867/m.183228 type:complete len:241 (+) Transcript_69867:84-806(+)
MAFKLALATSVALAASALECSITGYYYEPPDMVGTAKSIEASWNECQRRCNTTVYCERFQFWPDGGCQLAGNNQTLTKATCGPAGEANCSGLYAIVGSESCDNASYFPDPGLAVEGPAPPLAFDAQDHKSWPIWAWLLLLALLAAAGVGAAYAMGLLSGEKKKKKKRKSAERDAETAVNEALVPSQMEAVPMYTTAPVMMTSGTYQAAPQQYYAQAAPQYAQAAPQYVVGEPGTQYAAQR